MKRIGFLLVSAAVALSACAAPSTPKMASDGKPLPKVYRIGSNDASKIQFRMLDSINSLRQATGGSPLQMNAQLNAAAATHSRDMAIQNRPWHFGSDGSSPIERVQRVGYTGQLKGENISETYETELETLGAWMEKADTRNVVLDKTATDMGFSYHQETNGKIWWTLITGAPTSSVALAAN